MLELSNMNAHLLGKNHVRENYRLQLVLQQARAIIPLQRLKLLYVILAP